LAYCEKDAIAPGTVGEVPKRDASLILKEDLKVAGAGTDDGKQFGF
jgi:hypothetical protein